MKKCNLYKLLVFTLLSFFTSFSYAWDHSVELGYGRSHDPNHTKYTNSGVSLSGDIIALKRTPWTFWSINGALGQWYTTTPQNKQLTTGALSLALRFYGINLIKSYPFYLLGSAGPAYLSSQKFGFNTQASHLTIQTNLGLGIELNKMDINLRLQHFSNAKLGQPNQGFNILYLASIGYLF